LKTAGGGGAMQWELRRIQTKTTTTCSDANNNDHSTQWPTTTKPLLDTPTRPCTAASPWGGPTIWFIFNDSRRCRCFDVMRRAVDRDLLLLLKEPRKVGGRDAAVVEMPLGQVTSSPCSSSSSNSLS
jgi:hypothetical protein